MPHFNAERIPDNNGTARTGVARIRDFDLGMVSTLGGVEVEDPQNMTGYYLQNVEGIHDPFPIRGVPGDVQGPSGWQGVPIVFSMPEDKDARFKLPMVWVRRDVIQPAYARMQPGTTTYAVPSRGSRPVTLDVGTTNSPDVVSGFDGRERGRPAVPYDLMYTVRVVSRYRGQTGRSDHVNSLIEYTMRVFQPYSGILVTDSLGDTRYYHAFSDIIGQVDSSLEVADRVLGFDIAVRVEAELDLNDPDVYRTVTKRPNISVEIEP